MSWCSVWRNSLRPWTPQRPALTCRYVWTLDGCSVLILMWLYKLWRLPPYARVQRHTCHFRRTTSSWPKWSSCDSLWPGIWRWRSSAKAQLTREFTRQLFFFCTVNTSSDIWYWSLWWRSLFYIFTRVWASPTDRNIYFMQQTGGTDHTVCTHSLPKSPGHMFM